MEKIYILPDEEALIEGLKAHKPAAFEALYTKYASMLYGTILQIVQHQNIAQQVLEQVFITIWNNIEQYETTNSNATTWMRDIAHTLAHNNKNNYKNNHKNNYQNGNKNNINIEASQNADLGTISSDNQKIIKNNKENQNLQIQLLVSTEEQRKVVQEVAEVVSEKVKQEINHKIIIDLVYFRGYSVEAIAKDLDLSVENVKNIIKIALNQLKQNR